MKEKKLASLSRFITYVGERNDDDVDEDNEDDDKYEFEFETGPQIVYFC